MSPSTIGFKSKQKGTNKANKRNDKKKQFDAKDDLLKR